MAPSTRTLLLVKLHYFSYFAGVASLWSFVTVTGKQLGISEVNIGVVFTFAPVIGCISNPFFGALADKLTIRRKLFLVFILLNLILCLSFALLPYNRPIHTQDNESLLNGCRNTSSEVVASRNFSNFEDTTAATVSLTTVAFAAETGFSSPVFWAFAVLAVLEWTAMAVVTSIADHFCFQTLGDAPHLYGAQRVWGSIGWGGATFLAGVLIDFVSEVNMPKDYTPCFYLVAIFLTINFICSVLWKVEEEAKPKTMGKSLSSLMAEPRILLFVVACISVGVFTGLQWNFLYWYIENLAENADTAEKVCSYTTWLKIIQGLVSAVQCIAGEVPFFYLSGWFQKKIGHANCMTLCISAFALRFFLYSLLQNPWHVMPIEILQGFTYGIFYSTMASYAYIISPPGAGATVQSFVAAMFEGVGVGLGCIMAGFGFKGLSGRSTFRIYAGLAVVMAVLHFVGTKCVDRRKPQYQAPSTKEVEMDSPSDNVCSIELKS